MRKKITLLIATLILGFAAASAQDFIPVSGQVTDEDNADPVAGHAVNITADSAYTSVVFTNEAGFYYDTLPGTNYGFVHISTEDNCSNYVHDTTIQNPSPNVSIVADFQICTESGGGGEECQADFYYTIDSLNEYQVYFWDASTPPNDITSWSWSFADGTGSSEQNPVHTYNSPGIYPVCLTIETGSDSCSSTFCMDVLVGGGSGNDCQAGFTYFADSNNTVFFTDISTPENEIVSWFWEFQEGATSAEQNPTYTFGEAGIYPVCLTIQTLDSCISTFCQDVVVNGGSGGECEADFYYQIDSLNWSSVAFFDNSTPAELVDSWTWEFGDGTTSSEQNPVHTYNAPGTYNVCLSITTDSLGCTDTYCGEVVVQQGSGGDCQADFTYQADSTDPSTIYFFDQSTPANQVYSWYWVFGEGAVSTQQNPVYTFGEPGTYNVCLTIEAFTSNVDSCTSTYCMEVIVGGGTNSYYLGGNSFAGIYQVDVAFAYAYQEGEGGFMEVYSQMVDSLGYYLFFPPGGNYYTKVEPTPNSAYFNTHLPTYYGDVIHWEDAQMINLNQNIFNADINLVEMALLLEGDGVISGHIVHQDQNRNETPATDIQVMLANEAGHYVGMMYSDEEGYFEFGQLPNGTYTLYAEVMGKSIVPKEFTLNDENHNVGDIVMVIGETSILFGINDVSSKYVENISDVYPNPGSDYLNIDIELKEASRINTRIIDLRGQLLRERNFELYQSESLQMNIADLSPGIYLLEVITEDQYRISKRFVKY